MIELEEKSNVGSEIKKGVFYNTSSKIVYEVFRIISSIIIARILVPEDFGIMGIATIATEFAKRTINFGFNLGLIQSKEIDDKIISTTFVLNLGIGVVMFLLLFAMAPALGVYFRNDRLESVLRGISIIFVLRAFCSIHMTLLERKLAYGKVAIANLLSEFISIVTTIITAYMGHGVWSLVYGRWAAEVVVFFVAIGFTRWMPKFAFSKEAFSKISVFGVWIFLQNQADYWANNIDYIIIGRRLGTAALGYYERAFNIITMPQRRVSREATSVLISGFSRIQDEDERILRGYRKAILSVSFINYPLLIGLMLVAPEFILLMYGEKWMPTVLPLQILCMAGLMRSIDIVGRSILTAKNMVNLLFKRQVLFLALLGLSCTVGSHWGIVGVAWGVMIANAVYCCMMIVIVGKIMKTSLSAILSPQVPAFAYSVAMTAGVLLYKEFAVMYLHPLSATMLISSVGVGVIAYSSAVYLLEFKEMRDLRVELYGDFLRGTRSVRKISRKYSDK